MENKIEDLNLKKLYVFLYICKNDLIKEEETKTSIDELLNNEIFNNIDKNITIPTGIFNKCNFNIKDDVLNGFNIITKKLGDKYEKFYFEIMKKFMYPLCFEQDYEEFKKEEMNLEKFRKHIIDTSPFIDLKNKYRTNKGYPKVSAISNTINSIINSFPITYKKYKEFMNELIYFGENEDKSNVSSSTSTNISLNVLSNKSSISSSNEESNILYPTNFNKNMSNMFNGRSESNKSITTEEELFKIISSIYNNQKELKEILINVLKKYNITKGVTLELFKAIMRDIYIITSDKEFIPMFDKIKDKNNMIDKITLTNYINNLVKEQNIFGLLSKYSKKIDAFITKYTEKYNKFNYAKFRNIMTQLIDILGEKNIIDLNNYIRSSSTSTNISLDVLSNKSSSSSSNEESNIVYPTNFNKNMSNIFSGFLKSNKSIITEEELFKSMSNNDNNNNNNLKEFKKIYIDVLKKYNITKGITLELHKAIMRDIFIIMIDKEFIPLFNEIKDKNNTIDKIKLKNFVELQSIFYYKRYSKKINALITEYTEKYNKFNYAKFRNIMIQLGDILDGKNIIDLNKKFYNILGLDETTSIENIKKAYRKLARIHHPNKRGDAEKFKKLGEAYDELKKIRRFN